MNDKIIRYYLNKTGLFPYNLKRQIHLPCSINCLYKIIQHVWGVLQLIHYSDTASLQIKGRVKKNFRYCDRTRQRRWRSCVIHELVSTFTPSGQRQICRFSHHQIFSTLKLSEPSGKWDQVLNSIFLIRLNFATFGLIEISENMKCEQHCELIKQIRKHDVVLDDCDLFSYLTSNIYLIWIARSEFPKTYID